MTGIAPLPEDDELLAAELAFGLLDATEREAVEARRSTDSAFAAACRRWRDHAAGMLDGLDEQPRSAVWRAIEARLPANDVRVPAGARGRSLRLWQAATALATAAAIVLAVVAIDRPPAPAFGPEPAQSRAAPPLVAMLSGERGPVVSVSFDRTSMRLVVAPFGLIVGNHAAQLWVIPADGHPRSLGLIEPSKPGTPPAAADARLIVPGVTLAISAEPIGGSPTGQPTGPVIVSGKIVEA